MRAKATLEPYGLTEASLAALYEKQGGLCKLCGVSESELAAKHSKPDDWPSDRVLHIDHDHDRGLHAVRGLLCWRCNYDLEAYIRQETVVHPGNRGISKPRKRETRFEKYLVAATVAFSDKAELIGRISEQILYAFGEGCGGSDEEYAWLLRTRGVTEEQDVKWQYILEDSLGVLAVEQTDPLDKDDPDDADMIAFLNDETAVITFLREMLANYLASNKVYAKAKSRRGDLDRGLRCV